jgi:hypothetical protein
VTSEKQKTESRIVVPSGRKLTAVVVRSSVEDGRPYNEYKAQLRHDFFYSCAYCTVTEAEAQAVRLLIDHYEPVSGNPELANAYANLMYACEECNLRKGDRCPPPEARAEGKKFFRIDIEPRGEHFSLVGDELVGLTETGKFTILACDLNRASLVRLRNLRRRLYDYEGFAGEGIMALANFAIDQLAPEIRLRALSSIKKILKTAEEVFDSFDELLIEFAKSSILADEMTGDEKQKNKERLAKLREIEGLLPGNWRGRKNKAKRH